MCILMTVCVLSDLTYPSLVEGESHGILDVLYYIFTNNFPDHVDDPKPSSLTMWKKIILLILGICAICGSIFIGGLFYAKHQEQQRKRFY